MVVKPEMMLKPWDSDHTALVHVLWAAERKGMIPKINADELASFIMQSTWIQAVRAQEFAAGQDDQ